MVLHSSLVARRPQSCGNLATYDGLECFAHGSLAISEPSEAKCGPIAGVLVVVTVCEVVEAVVVLVVSDVVTVRVVFLYGPES